MGEEVRGVPEAAAVGPSASEASAETGIGRYLAGQRRLRGVSLDELAQLTKIPSRSLERLESGAFDSASDGFVRGFVRTVAEALGLNPDEAVMRLLEEPRADPGAAPRAAIGLGRYPLFLPVAAVASFVLAVVLVWQLVSFWMSPSSEPEAREVLLRRDPVRELALEARLAPPTPAVVEEPIDAPTSPAAVAPAAAAEAPPVALEAEPASAPRAVPEAAPSAAATSAPPALPELEAPPAPSPATTTVADAPSVPPAALEIELPAVKPEPAETPAPE